MNPGSSIAKTTGAGSVLPFYVYASFSFLAACMLLLANIEEVNGHYFQPATLAIVHTLALGWGTMMILGAGYQLIPVIAESSLFSENLSLASFILAGLGIPMLVYGFFTFEFGAIAITGAVLIILSVVCYLSNFAITASRSEKPNVETLFLFSAALWLLLTVVSGFLLLLNFNKNILPFDSLHYLVWHSHMGLAGWFLLTITGAASRLLPMFTLSKYTNKKLLWAIYILINTGLVVLTVREILRLEELTYYVPLLFIASGIFLFGFFVYRVVTSRIRRKIDQQVKTSLVSIGVMMLPILILSFVLIRNENLAAARLYGFIIFFGWISTIIIAMTFKTLPFIIWNRLYGGQAVAQLQPADLFSNKMFSVLISFYASGFLTCIAGIVCGRIYVLTAGAILLVLAALVYNYGSIRLMLRS